MADPLSVTTSITAVAQTLVQIYSYGKDVKGAKTEIKRLCDELSSLKGVLEYVQLQYETTSKSQEDHKDSTESSGDSKNIFRSHQFVHVLRDTNLFLEDLQLKLGKPKSNLHQAWTRLTWSFTKTEIAEQIARIERTKSYFMVSMLNQDLEYSRGIYDEIRTLKELLQRPPSYEKDSDRQKTFHESLRVIAPVDPRALHKKACKLRLPNTGIWFLDGADFKKWATGEKDHNTIWITGKSGAGKTVMFSAAIEHFKAKLAQEGDAVAYFYCAFNDAASQEPANIVGSFIAQLVQQKADLQIAYETQFKSTKANGESLPSSEMYEFFQRCCKEFPRVFLFVDAINESIHKYAIIRCLRELRDRAANISVFLTSTELVIDRETRARLHPMIVSMNEQRISLDVQVLVEASLQKYDNLFQLRQEIKDEIRFTLIQGAHGMYARRPGELRFLADLWQVPLGSVSN